ncbi:MAG: hypothetical protein AAGD96_15845, partial [Chloroflexota bacterium]
FIRSQIQLRKITQHIYENDRQHWKQLGYPTSFFWRPPEIKNPQNNLQTESFVNTFFFMLRLAFDAPTWINQYSKVAQNVIVFKRNVVCFWVLGLLALFIGLAALIIENMS